MEGNETFEARFLGAAEEVCEDRVADDEMIMIKVRFLAFFLPFL